MAMISLNNMEKLQEYAELEGSELGSGCLALLDMAEKAHYVSDGFSKIVNTEIKMQLEYFEEHCRIVEEVEIKEVTITHKRLEWDWE